ncbi:hypothetical protein ACQEVB_21135 [Pseudonocardia sp. CA-107938]|uniref:hypothetical protein n=1 Tax=Pseudonocardia sp. CA-107938 TaxID=3240021 RepID=UPI003D92B9D7
MRGERTTIVQPPQAGRPPAVPPSQGQTTVLRAPQPGLRGPQLPTTVTPGGPQAPTMVTPVGPPPRPPMGHPMEDSYPGMGPVVSQDRPHSGPRRPVKRTGAASYARSLAPLVGMSIVVVVLIAGITAWISSTQDRSAAPPAPRPAAGLTTAPVAPFPSSAVVPSSAPKVVTPKPKPKAVTPSKVVPPPAPSSKAAAPTSAAQKTSKAPVEPPNNGQTDTPEEPDRGQTCGLFACTQN